MFKLWFPRRHDTFKPCCCHQSEQTTSSHGIIYVVSISFLWFIIHQSEGIWFWSQQNNKRPFPAHHYVTCHKTRLRVSPSRGAERSGGSQAPAAAARLASGAAAGSSGTRPSQLSSMYWGCWGIARRSGSFSANTWGLGWCTHRGGRGNRCVCFVEVWGIHEHYSEAKPRIWARLSRTSGGAEVSWFMWWFVFFCPLRVKHERNLKHWIRFDFLAFLWPGSDHIIPEPEPNPDTQANNHS